jgi:hypothetical protein
VESTECTSQPERHDQDARPEDEHVLGPAQVEAPDAVDQRVADGQVEETPEDADRRGGQPLPGRRRARTLEGVPGDPIAEVGEREKGAPEEVGHVMVPAHRRFHGVRQSPAVVDRSSTRAAAGANA